MTLYPTLRRRRTATLAGDAVTLLLVVLFAWFGLKVHDAVAELAGLGRGLQDAGAAIATSTRDATGAVRGGFDSAADAVEDTPVIGGDVAGALRSAGGSATAPVVTAGVGQGRRLAATGRAAEARAYHAANALGWLAFALPTLLLLALRLPPRVRQARRLSVAGRMLALDPADPERERELARRAAYGLPYAQLARFTRDPIGDLLDGHHAPLLAALGDDAELRLTAPAGPA